MSVHVVPSRSSTLLLDLLAVQLSALQGSLERYHEHAGLVDAGGVERVLSLVVKLGGAVLDSVPHFRAQRVEDASVASLLDRLERVAVLVNDLVEQFHGTPHGVLGSPLLKDLRRRLGRCRG
jgi:hypothetical protein